MQSHYPLNKLLPHKLLQESVSLLDLTYLFVHSHQNLISCGSICEQRAIVSLTTHRCGQMCSEMCSVAPVTTPNSDVTACQDPLEDTSTSVQGGERLNHSKRILKFLLKVNKLFSIKMFKCLTTCCDCYCAVSYIGVTLFLQVLVKTMMYISNRLV